jgi:hypothetical protein
LDGSWIGTTIGLKSPIPIGEKVVEMISINEHLKRDVRD